MKIRITTAVGLGFWPQSYPFSVLPKTESTIAIRQPLLYEITG